MLQRVISHTLPEVTPEDSTATTSLLSSNLSLATGPSIASVSSSSEIYNSSLTLLRDESTKELTESMEPENEQCFNLDKLDKSFPLSDQFIDVMPMLNDIDSALLYQLLADQVFCRFCLLVPILVDVSSLYSKTANVSSTVDSASSGKGSKKGHLSKRVVDMNTTEDTDDEVVSPKVQISADPIEHSRKNTDSSRGLLSTSKQTVFDQMYGDICMLPPKRFNFSKTIGAMAHPNDLIKNFHIGRGNEPEGSEFKDNMELLIVTGDGAPVKTHLNMIITPDVKLHSRILHCKANLHVVFSSLGPFHVECKFIKNVISFYAPFFKDCLTRIGRKTEGQQNYTMNLGRFDDSFEYIWIVQDAICVSAIRSFVRWRKVNARTVNTRVEPVTQFGEFLSLCDSKGRTALMFMIHLEPFYLMNYAVRAKQFDLYVAALLISLEFDHAIGDVDYGTLKAYFVLRLVMLSEYWREIFAHFFFATNLNEKGVCLDLLCEYIHKNVKSRIPKVGRKDSFYDRLTKIELNLPDTVRASTSHHNPMGFTPSPIKPLSMKVILQNKKVDMQKVLLLADSFEHNGLWELAQEVPHTLSASVVSSSASSSSRYACIDAMFFLASISVSPKRSISLKISLKKACKTFKWKFS